MGLTSNFFSTLLLFFILFSYAYSENNTQNCSNEYSFQIIIQNKTFNDKIEFSFSTNASNYKIEYWIENANSQIVKNKYTTTNLNVKQYTPGAFSEYFIVKATLTAAECKLNTSQKAYFNFSQENIPNTPEQNQSNPNQENQNNQSANNPCNYTFEILTKENITTNKIEYKFTTNSTNYTINYWIENYAGNIAKQKQETTNTNTKQYTPPKYTQIYFIKAELNTQECKIQDSKMIIYYSETKSYEKETISEIDEDKKTYIKLKNYNNIISGKTEDIEYEIYRGNTNKRTIYFYLNNKLLSSIEIPKYTTVKGKIKLEFENGKNEFLISGLDIEENYIFIIKNKETEILSTAKKEEKFIIEKIKLDKNFLYFNLSTNKEYNDISCYVLYLRTQVSNTINITEKQNHFRLQLNINDTKLQNKENLNIYPLKLLCKCSKNNSNYYDYSSISFNYSIENKKEIILTMESYSNEIKKNTENINSIFFSLTEIENKPITQNHYETKNSIIAKNSFFAIFIATTALLMLMISIW